MHTKPQLQARALTPTEANKRITSKGGTKRRQRECKFNNDTEMAELPQTEDINDHHDMKQKIHNLFEQLKVLTQQRDYYKRGMNIYEEAMHYYKGKCMQMTSLIHPVLTNDQMDTHALPLITSVTPQNREITEMTSINDHDTDIEMDNERNDDNADTVDTTHVDFEDAYHFSVTCYDKDCGQHFDTYESYSTHLQTHYPKPFTCDLGCNAKPKCIGNLIAHIAMHRKEKPFQCNNCAHSTTTKGDMKKHWQTTKNGKPHSKKPNRRRKINVKKK
eukprot:215553_1